MEVVARENVKVPNSVVVSGLTDTESDQDVADFLSRYGRIGRTIRVDDPESPYHRHAIVEYESGAAVRAIEPLLPYSYESPSEIIYLIKALTSEYVPTATVSATQSFLSELQNIAKLSGRSFEEILQEQLSECIKSLPSSAEPSDEPEIESPNTEIGNEQAQIPVTQPQVASSVKTKEHGKTPQWSAEAKVFSQIKEKSL